MPDHDTRSPDIQCIESFEFLCKDYGFSTPETRQAGRETNIFFRKGDRAVVINLEPGSFPLVEFRQSGIDPDGSRYPPVRPNTTPKIGNITYQMSPYSADDTGMYLDRYAAALREREHEFLTGNEQA